ncbi:cytochrome c maturation protein CcmE [Streptosporangium sandarakinum]|uniref:cytochrome c maturation protein CcmE n=1 Tax=Streptosporangium sandarakinum TaxID=1260955 RepID=UPI0033B23CA1
MIPPRRRLRRPPTDAGTPAPSAPWTRRRPLPPLPDRVRRRLPLLLVGVAALTLGALAFSGIGDGMVYYRTPTELAGRDAGPAGRLRVGGLVLPHSVRAEGDVLRFRLSDGVGAVEVLHRGEVPPVFREGQGAVAEGVLGPGGVFRSDRLMVKHSDEYRAAEPAR